jgi:class 3 adenylate cyclase/TolB-like protein/Tfp pilus assembly protein PilF
MNQQSRQLAAILFTDIVGYTSMMQHDEQAAVAVNRHYISVLKQTVNAHHGSILNDYGDGSLCSFPSATDALQCAVEMQKQLQTEPKVPLRIGLHIGEIFFDDGKVMGDSVNIASRIQSLGQGNTILFSKEVFDKLKNQSGYKSISLGKFEFKNVDEPMEVFALINDGLIVPRREEMRGKLRELENKSTSRKWLVVAAIVILFSAGFFLYKALLPATDFEGEKSIAVLPFEIVSMDNSEDYISDGITQDIINNLSKISSLEKVIGWFSVRNFRNSKKSLKQIADELGVAAILSGTMQMQAGKTRIITELIEISTNNRLWGDDFEYESKDILSIQSIVAGQIVDALKAGLTPDQKKELSKRYTENVEAYKYYVRGRNFWYARGRENIDSAEANFKQAIKLDPNYALAYAGIADCYTYNYKGMSQLEAIPIARGYANQALALDSNLSEGLTSLAFIQHNFDYEWTQSKKTLGRAIELGPNNSTAHLYYGNLLQFTGNTKDGLREVEKAVAIDPLAFGANWVLGRNYYFAGENRKAIAQLKKTLEIAPKQQEVLSWSLGLVYVQSKMYTQARQQFDKISTAEHNNPIDYYPIMQSYGYALLGDKAKARQLLEVALNEKGKVWISPYRLAQAYVALGDYHEALNQLDNAYNNRDLHMFWIKVDPGFDPIRNEERFKNLLKKMNLN